MKKLNIVIPTINRLDLLLEALNSINKQQEFFEKLLIIDNGNQNILETIKNLDMVINNKVEVSVQSTNLGVSGSWNLGINKFIDSDFILFLNDDVVIGTNQLKEVHENLLDKKQFWLATGNCLWSMFTLSKECWEYFINKDGYVFDVNFFPAYYEDNDFHYRIILTGKPDIHVGAIEMSPVLFRNSMTIKRDRSLNNNFNKNHQYYMQKWGGTPGHEKFRTPFNR